MQKLVVKSKSGRYKKGIWITSLLAIFIVVITGMVLLEVRWKPRLSQKIKDGVYHRSFELYKLDFKEISFNFFTASATLHQVSLTPDTTVYNKFKAMSVAPANTYQIRLEKLHLNGISFLTAYFKRVIDIKTIILEHPLIDIRHYAIMPLPEVLKNEPTLYQMISNRIRSVDVKAIKLVDAEFDYIDGETSKSIHSAKHLNISLNDFLVDSLSQYDTTRHFYAKEIDFARSGNKLLSREKLDTIKSIVLPTFSK
ncbi:MAG: hypothetical protein P0Y49_20060 [Candidatus Pedobacter colombiensis]|uniref:DUF748 domain-containing protein n=1 Tax=Candidatus Pedobacter colombiensis TaxID=3121371 RepID=A0AAJ5W6U9_9SPHI|nr:hypothetical protein [Pedobacter sp.]WEK19074.1 MAG: hypothetical protein P0Y49_20060 [Pedobacter sp.]